MSTTKIAAAFLEACGFHEEAVQLTSYVLDYVERDQVHDGFDGPTWGFRLRLLSLSPDDSDWIAEITDLHRPWPLGVGLGRYETQQQVLDLLVGLRQREKAEVNL